MNDSQHSWLGIAISLSLFLSISLCLSLSLTGHFPLDTASLAVALQLPAGRTCCYIILWKLTLNHEAKQVTKSKSKSSTHAHTLIKHTQHTHTLRHMQSTQTKQNTEPAKQFDNNTNTKRAAVTHEKQLWLFSFKHPLSPSHSHSHSAFLSLSLCCSSELFSRLLELRACLLYSRSRSLPSLFSGLCLRRTFSLTFSFVS